MGSAERQVADLAELVQGVIDMLRHVGRYRDKQMEFASAGPVMASVNIKPRRRGGGGGCSAGQEGVHASHDGSSADNVELIVTDNGRGMSKVELAEVFQPRGLRQGRQGTGLGLAISARIVKDHGGCITAASAGPGQGAQFRVSLPCVEQSLEHAARVLHQQSYAR
jgi:hypothetical protein